MLNKDGLPPPPSYLNIIGINLSADAEQWRLFVRRLERLPFSKRNTCAEYGRREGSSGLDKTRETFCGHFGAS